MRAAFNMTCSDVIFFSNMTFRSHWRRGFNYLAVNATDRGCRFDVNVKCERNISLCEVNANNHCPSVVHWQVSGTGYQFIIVIHVATLSSRRLHEDPCDEQTCPQRSSGAIILLNKWWGSSVWAMCLTSPFEMRSAVLGGRSLLLCRVGVFAAWTKDWME